MKRTFLYCSAILLSSSLFFACKKQEPPVPPVPQCQIQQFGAAIPNVPLYPGGKTITTPYLFKKTFDNSGKVKTLDAYLYEMSGANHINATVLVNGNKGYILNNEKANDTLFTFLLNNNGKVISADDNVSLANTLDIRFHYEYFYNSQNKLIKTTYTDKGRFPTTGSDTTIYDANGNVVINGGAKYEYDLGKTASIQFYHDIEYRFGGTAKGTRLLSYLNYFPELTSPPNLRIIARIIPTSGGAYYINSNLFMHQFDASGKLKSYGFSGSALAPETINPIIYTCDAVQP